MLGVAEREGICAEKMKRRRIVNRSVGRASLSARAGALWAAMVPLSLRRVPPHPDPLPPGEGALNRTFCFSRIVGSDTALDRSAAWSDIETARVSPSPQGRGRGEGEGSVVDPTSVDYSHGLCGKLNSISPLHSRNDNRRLGYFVEQEITP